MTKDPSEDEQAVEAQIQQDEAENTELPSYEAFAHSYLAQAEDPDTEDQYRLVYATIAQVSATLALTEKVTSLMEQLTAPQVIPGPSMTEVL